MTIYDDNAPAQDASIVTASASPLAKPAKMLYMATAGSITVTTMGGTTLSLGTVPIGTVIPLSCTHVTSISEGASVIALHES